MVPTCTLSLLILTGLVTKGDPERLDLWVINMKRQNWIPSLCSQHLRDNT